MGYCQHEKASGKDLTYLDPITNEKYLPYVIEPAVGVERLFFMFFTDAYDEEELENGDTRVVMRFSPVLAPVKVAVLPLRAKLHGEKAEEVRHLFAKHFAVQSDGSGSIGKRYRRQDEIGTPFCITIDDESLENNTVTLRYRDSMAQERMSVEEALQKVQKEIEF